MIKLKGRVIARSEARRDNMGQAVPPVVTIRIWLDHFTSSDVSIYNKHEWELDDEVEVTVGLVGGEKPRLVT